MNVKFCTKCKQTKPVTEFAKSGFFNNRQCYRTACKNCYAVKVRAVRHENHVVEDRSPHPKKLVQVPVRGWGYLGATR